MVSPFHDTPIAHDEDRVGAVDGGQPMRYNKTGTPSIIFSKARWTRISVRVSMLLVASSRISIGGSVSIIRAMQIS